MVQLGRLALALALALVASPLAAKTGADGQSPASLTVGVAATAPVRAVPGVGQFDAATGAARMLFGVGFRGAGGDPVATARAYLGADAARLGLAAGGSEAGLPVRAVIPGKGATVVRFRQRVGELPVYGGEIAVAVGARGDVVFVSSSYRTGAGAPANRALLDASAALDAALAHLGARAAATLDAGRVLFADGGESRVAWRFLLDTRGAPAGEWEVLVDAESGAVLRAEDRLLYVDANGQAFEPDPLSSALASYNDAGFVDGSDADTAQLTAQTYPVTLRDVTFSSPNYSLVGPYAQCNDWDAPAGTCPTTTDGNFNWTRNSDNFEAVNVYHHIDSLLRHYNADLGLNVLPFAYVGGVKYDPRGFSGADNSSYSGGTQRLRFGEGGVDDAEDADVVIHELGHGMHDWVTGGSLSQVEGLSEGTGDYFAVSYSRSYGGQWTPADPEYYWVFSWDGHNPFWAGRLANWDDTHTYPTDLTASIHTNGQFWASCSLRIWDVLGRDLTDAAMLEGLRLTGSTTNQAAAAQAVLQAARNMDYSPSALQVIQLRYNSSHCNYGVTIPALAGDLFFDGFETGGTGRWSSSGS